MSGRIFESMKDLGELLVLLLIIGILVFALFGVTYEGKHYGVTCESKRGIVIENGVPETTTSASTTAE